MTFHETPIQDLGLRVQQVHAQLQNLCLEMQSLKWDIVSVSLFSLPPVIKYALTIWSQSVKAKFCHFSESSNKIWSLGIRFRICFHSFQICSLLALTILNFGGKGGVGGDGGEEGEMGGGVGGGGK